MRRICVLLALIAPALASAQSPPNFLWLDDFELCPSPQPYWPDRDSDDYGDDDYSFVGCVQPPGFFPVDPGDCDDLNPGINPSAAEQCNGIDEDCDAMVDENALGAGTSCDTGLVGACSSGTFQCQGAAGLVCISDTPASPEVCNGIDDDCDGHVDEGNPGGGQTCNTGLPGACSTGTTVCQAGVLVCVPDNQPCP
ncbi:MAG: hypothetical protein DWB45_04135 [Xanthomonadales bacterium]|nr:hypothetical protein [Xanthomonadales bacterium]MDL1870092.1 hypothetical protein [Gammaproteobacteria bacterium PRO6]